MKYPMVARHRRWWNKGWSSSWRSQRCSSTGGKAEEWWGGADERSRQDCANGKAAAPGSGVGPTGVTGGRHDEAGGVRHDRGMAW
jgi:hypothetical protein